MSLLLNQQNVPPCVQEMLPHVPKQQRLLFDLVLNNLIQQKHWCNIELCWHTQLECVCISAIRFDVNKQFATCATELLLPVAAWQRIPLQTLAQRAREVPNLTYVFVESDGDMVFYGARSFPLAQTL
eukprot:GDKI01048210.1.p1 GENE.GDKI01048210.1~~GDKI01048210.1.p1  ORF type:complete len:127 (+),score=14.70 GDKI01048210.1:93-473(+)